MSDKRPVIHTLPVRITAYRQNLRFLPRPMCHLSTKFCENRLSSFCVILLTANEQTNADENTTSLAEVTIYTGAGIKNHARWEGIGRGRV